MFQWRKIAVKTGHGLAYNGGVQRESLRGCLGLAISKSATDSLESAGDRLDMERDSGDPVTSTDREMLCGVGRLLNSCSYNFQNFETVGQK